MEIINNALLGVDYRQNRTIRLKYDGGNLKEIGLFCTLCNRWAYRIPV